ncbi:hypothetical protein MASR2M15_00440 [Anaerolineales bacterium]
MTKPLSDQPSFERKINDIETPLNSRPDANLALQMLAAVNRNRSRSDQAQGDFDFYDYSQLQIKIKGLPETLNYVIKDEVVIGRSDNLNNFKPDIDLAALGGYRMGVSRQHIRLNRVKNRLLITDLGSRNGTRLNGMTLVTGRPEILGNGDQLQIGKLEVSIYFISPHQKLSD